MYPVLAALEAAGMPLAVHGKIVDPEVDVFDRERVFIERVLLDLLERFPGLKIVFEHITTKDAVDFVLRGPERLAATITAHHLLMSCTRCRALFAPGWPPGRNLMSPRLVLDQHTGTSPASAAAPARPQATALREPH